MRLCALCLSRPLAAPSGFALRAQVTRPLRGGRISPLREINTSQTILSILLILSKNKTRRESTHDYNT